VPRATCGDARCQVCRLRPLPSRCSCRAPRHLHHQALRRLLCQRLWCCQQLRRCSSCHGRSSSRCRCSSHRLCRPWQVCLPHWLLPAPQGANHEVTTVLPAGWRAGGSKRKLPPVLPATCAKAMPWIGTRYSLPSRPVWRSSSPSPTTVLMSSVRAASQSLWRRHPLRLLRREAVDQRRQVGGSDCWNARRFSGAALAVLM